MSIAISRFTLDIRRSMMPRRVDFVNRTALRPVVLSLGSEAYVGTVADARNAQGEVEFPQNRRHLMVSQSDEVDPLLSRAGADMFLGSRKMMHSATYPLSAPNVSPCTTCFWKAM